MLEKRTISGDAETDRCIQLVDDFFILAEKELSAFISTVEEFFGAEQARQSALDWIEELELMDWPSGGSIPDWRRATLGASARLAILMSGSGEPSCPGRREARVGGQMFGEAFAQRPWKSPPRPASRSRQKCLLVPRCHVLEQ
jgi:hypothetical protein